MEQKDVPVPSEFFSVKEIAESADVTGDEDTTNTVADEPGYQSMDVDLSLQGH